MTTPVTHLQEGQKLEALAEIDLYRITLLGGGVFLFKADNSVTWMGDTYEGITISMTGESRSSEDEENKPTLRIANPAGILNKPALDGLLDGASVIRKRVLSSHLYSNTNIFTQRMWYVERVKEVVVDQFVGLEIRPLTDGPNFMIPYRQFIPPEFPTVSM